MLTRQTTFRDQAIPRLAPALAAVRRKLIRPLLLVGLLPLFGGCVSLNPDMMVTGNMQAKAPHPVSVSVSVGKASRGEGWYSGSVRPAQFEQALRASLEKTGIFSGLSEEQAADYALTVEIFYAASHPGFNMTAWVNANWKLVHKASGKMLWSKEIKGEGRATVGEAFNGAKRQYIALERAGRANIDEALTELAELKL